MILTAREKRETEQERLRLDYNDLDELVNVFVKCIPEFWQVCLILFSISMPCFGSFFLLSFCAHFFVLMINNIEAEQRIIKFYQRRTQIHFFAIQKIKSLSTVLKILVKIWMVEGRKDKCIDRTCTSAANFFMSHIKDETFYWDPKPLSNVKQRLKSSISSEKRLL